jgi:membrane protein DedA with SNARE-associated domain
VTGPTSTDEAKNQTSQDTQNTTPVRRKKRYWFKERWQWFVVAALLITGITVSIVVFREHIADFKQYGYLGVFLISLMASATVIAFVPSVPVMFALGGVLNPFLVGLTAGVGEAIGELVGYFAGRSGHAFFIKGRPTITGSSEGLYYQLEKWIRTRGSLALFLSSAVFNPFFSVIGATAGALRFPAWKFFLIVWAGKTVKWTVIALVGYGLLSYILRLFGVDF